MTGISVHTFMHDPARVLSAILPEDLPGLLAAIDAAALEHNQPFEYSFRIRHAVSHELRWLQTQSRPGLLADGSVLFNGSFTDITTQKQLEAKVLDSQRLLKAAMDASMDGIWEWNLSNDEVLMSDAWFRQLGYEPGELPQRLDTFTRICHPDDVEPVFAAIAAIVEQPDGPGYSVQCRLRRKNGSWQWMLARGNVSQRDLDGRTLRLTGINTNIDAQKRSEEALANATRVAEDAARSKSDFLASMSHEIRTPMNAVIGFAELLRVSDLKPGQQQQLDKLLTASHSLLGIINDILDHSKIEAGKLLVENTPFSPAIALDHLHCILAPAASTKHLALHIEVPADLPEVLLGDSQRLGQVLLNLVGNAIKFTERGEVRLVVSWQPTTAGAVQLRFVVRDTGIGIDPERTAKLFQPFEQADPSISRRYGGTGLGLAISHRLVSLMGGEMGVESRPDAGSTFWFSLPFGIAATPLAPLAAKAPLDTTTLRGLRVLVAEDNDINLEILNELLIRIGIEVRSARDGGEAVAACAEGWPQLVLMDMQMPDIDGLTATTMLRQNVRFAALPIIALTANAMQEDRLRCLSAGMNDHLGKPIDVEDLYAMLMRWRPK